MVEMPAVARLGETGNHMLIPARPRALLRA